MQISIRSYLTMGTAAVVGAGAIAMTPVLPAAVPAAHLSSPVVADVSLTGSSVSLSDIVGLIGDSGLGGGDFSLSGIADLLGNIGGNFSLPDITDLLGNLGGNISLPDIFGLLNGGLADLLPGVPGDVVNTVLTEVIKEVRPLLKTAAGDIFQYVGSTFTGLFIGPDSLPAQIGAAVLGVPAVFKAALAALKAGDFGLAIRTLGDGLIAPIAAVRTALKAAVNGLKTFVDGQIQDFVGKVPAIVISAVEAAIGGLGAGAAVSARSMVSIPAAGAAVSDVAEPAAEDSAPAAAASRTPGAAASAEPAVAAEQARVVESPALQADESVAPPVNRPRAGAVRAAIADAVANGPAVTSRPKPTLRADRGNTERPRAAAAAARS